jgi:hypothetical protein
MCMLLLLLFAVCVVVVFLNQYSLSVLGIWFGVFGVLSCSCGLNLKDKITSAHGVVVSSYTRTYPMTMIMITTPQIPTQKYKIEK